MTIIFLTASWSDGQAKSMVVNSALVIFKGSYEWSSCYCCYSFFFFWVCNIWFQTKTITRSKNIAFSISLSCTQRRMLGVALLKLAPCWLYVDGALGPEYVNDLYVWEEVLYSISWHSFGSSSLILPFFNLESQLWTELIYVYVSERRKYRMRLRPYIACLFAFAPQQVQRLY